MGTFLTHGEGQKVAEHDHDYRFQAQAASDIGRIHKKLVTEQTTTLADFLKASSTF